MRKEKKSETIEIRLSLREKAAFAARVTARGETMSAAMRRLIANDAVPQFKPKEASIMKRIALAATPVALTAAILIAVSLDGVGARTDFKGVFNAKDANGDRFIDRDEMIKVMTRRAAAVDLPAACDGTELARKWTLTPEVLAEGEIDFADANRDGRLTLKEVVAAHERKRADDFVGADTDANGFVSVAELRAGFRADEVNISAACRAAIGLYSAARAPEIVTQLDTDGDGQVSLREFVDH